MQLGAQFAKWGLGFFLFGVLISLGIVAHYCVGARWPTGAVFVQNITLWWACPWTLSVAAVQAGGLGMVALGLTRLAAVRFAPPHTVHGEPALALPLCVLGLTGVFAVGYLGYFVFDAIWPSFYYSPVEYAKNLWLIGQGGCILLYFAGAALMFNTLRQGLGALRDLAGERS